MRWIFTGRFNAVMTAGAVTGYPDVVEIGRQPADGRVAVVAVVAARNVRWMFASRCRAVVARTASPNDLGVIDGVGRHEDVRVMAILADVRRLDMCGVLAHRVDAVMAAAAVINDTQVIEIRRAPRDG